MHLPCFCRVYVRHRRKVAGLASVHFDPASTVADLRYISVYPRFRGRGLGTRLLGRALSAASRHGATSVKLVVSRSCDTPFSLIPWYGRHGFVKQPDFLRTRGMVATLSTSAPTI